MNGAAVTVGAALVALQFGATAGADVFHKCMAADGAVSYADEPCPHGTRSERIEIESSGRALPPLPSRTAAEAILPAAPAAAPAQSAPAADATPYRPSLARQCGEARADSNWFYMQDAARMDAGTRAALAREEAERQRFIEEHCQ